MKNSVIPSNQYFSEICKQTEVLTEQRWRCTMARSDSAGFWSEHLCPLAVLPLRGCELPRSWLSFLFSHIILSLPTSVLYTMPLIAKQMIVEGNFVYREGHIVLGNCNHSQVYSFISMYLFIIWWGKKSSFLFSSLPLKLSFPFLFEKEEKKPCYYLFCTRFCNSSTSHQQYPEHPTLQAAPLKSTSSEEVCFKQKLWQIIRNLQLW